MPPNPTGRPPARDGVVATKVVLRGHVPQGEFFAARSGDSPFTPGALLVPGTVLDRPTPAWSFPDVSAEKPIPFKHSVVYEDSALVVVDKPHFLPATPNGRLVKESLQARLRASHGESVTLAHRLDRVTAGVMLAVKDPDLRGAYQRLFSTRMVTKTYLARTSHSLPLDDTWREVSLPMAKRGRKVVVEPGGTPTVTLCRAIDSTVVQLRPLTGYTHQLRVVCAHLGGPIVGDDLYPNEQPLDLYDFSQPLHLVATALEFADPVTGRRQSFSVQRGLPIRIEQ